MSKLLRIRNTLVCVSNARKSQPMAFESLRTSRIAPVKNKPRRSKSLLWSIVGTLGGRTPRAMDMQCCLERLRTVSAAGAGTCRMLTSKM